MLGPWILCRGYRERYMYVYCITYIGVAFSLYHVYRANKVVFMCLCYWYMYIYHNYNYSKCDVFIHVLVGNSGEGMH